MLLRADQPGTALGLLLDIMEKSGRCDLCRLVTTALHRRWRLDEHPNADLHGIECSIYSYTCGTLDPDLEEAKQSHRLFLRISARPLEITRTLEASNADLLPQIQLLDEDSHKFRRTRDLHGRRMADTVDVELVKRWIQLCEREHGSACESVWWKDDDGGLPDFVRMVDVQQMALVTASPGCRYVALSYVWGGPGYEYWTTMGNVNARSCPGGMSNCVLPMTIRDAIHLVQRLGERYLWIDALCIIQDSLEDKAAQIHIMDLVYGKATFTVFAASGDGVRAGLPGLSEGTRPPTQHIQVIQGLHLAIPLPSLREAAAKTIWNTRGWTFQELVLSRRRLFFTKDQVYFECPKDVWCEDIVAESKSMQYTTTPIRPRGVGMFLRPTRSITSIPTHYAAAVTKFSQRRLTHGSDVVAAMTAITNAMTKGYDAPGSDPKRSFRFGMWITQLDYALLWQPVIGAACHPRRTVADREHARWPSWAWTGWTGAVHYDDENHLTGIASPSTHPSPVESLVSAWYIVAEDAGVAELDVRRVSPIILHDRDPRSPGVYDKSFWGQEYYGSLLHVMAVQEAAADPRTRE
ncbi:hypothetical protein ID866_9026, partial [Astraeus odoratus]